MIREIDIRSYLVKPFTLIDVRSPGEYEKGHIPGALNIPLFSDAERAHIGTVYIKQSPEKATELAFQYALPKFDFYTGSAKKAATGDNIAIHCWRGGMRSRMFAEHLAFNGFPCVHVITGGYKAYRSFVHSAFDMPSKINIIGGFTGSGKTLIIHKLKENGLQAVDLEGIAGHKGSAFGGIGLPAQPTSEQFENDLFEQWKNLDLSQPVWLEDESHNIGGVNIPANLYNKMLESPVYFLQIPAGRRAEYLVKDYSVVSASDMAESILKISRRLGGLNTRLALQLLDERNYYKLAMLVLTYYDKAYLKGMRFHDQKKIFPIRAKDTDPCSNMRLIIKSFHANERNQAYSI
jgi:tRNA 2-selenouridine synthase